MQSFLSMNLSVKRVQMSDPVVWIKKASKSYGVLVALDVEELKIWPGEVLTLSGPNGAGKSTLLRLIGLLEEPDRAEMFRVFDKNAMNGGRPALRRRVGMVFQEPFLFKGSGYENIAMGLRWRGFQPEEIGRRARSLAELLGLVDLEKRARELSRGQAQRLALARTLALEPELLLLDEPLNALDNAIRNRLLVDLQPILTAGGRSTVYVTHSQEEAEQLGTRKLGLSKGTVVNITGRKSHS